MVEKRPLLELADPKYVKWNSYEIWHVSYHYFIFLKNASLRSLKNVFAANFHRFQTN